MKIIFISATCSEVDYEKICQRRKRPTLDSSQKFFNMFLDGLSQQDEVSVECITVPPLSRGTYPGFFIPGHKSEINGICYHNISIINFPVLKTLFAQGAVRRTLKRILKENKRETLRIICDPLLLEGLLPTIRLGRKNGITTVGFLTDMPYLADDCDSHKGIKKALYQIYNLMISKNISRLNRFVFLTESMSCIAPDKPWMLLDCIVNEKMLDGITPILHGDNLPHIVYAGKLHKEFGIDLLLKAIPLVKNNCIFDLYGDGNFAYELRLASEKYTNIKVHGIVPVKNILSAELAATLLINPRTSKGKFTKYSFPSKTAEYMLSGTPVVMFKLPGISAEYDQYLQYAETESPESFAQKIDFVLSMSETEREKIGRCAKRFVAENKNNEIQAKRVIKFLL